METILISLCIAICGGMIGFILGYRSGSGDMDRTYKDVYNITENQRLRVLSSIGQSFPLITERFRVRVSEDPPEYCPRDGMVDITDLKSVAFKACRFESDRGYHEYFTQLSWIEQLPSKQQVTGSNPVVKAKVLDRPGEQAALTVRLLRAGK